MSVLVVVLAVVAIAALGAVYLLIALKGTPNKVVVLDVVTTTTTAALVVFSALFNTPFILDIAVVYAILSFAAVLLVSRFLERSL